MVQAGSAPVEVQKELMRHSNLKTTIEICGLEPMSPCSIGQLTAVS